MAMDPEVQKKLQIFMVAAILLAGARAAYIVYERHEAMKEEVKPKQEIAMNADNYVTPKRLRPYDLKSARQLTEQPVWVKAGYQLTYYPYEPQRKKVDFAHAAGTLPPLQKLSSGCDHGCFSGSCGNEASHGCLHARWKEVRCANRSAKRG
jgi:hypothetical protein